MSCSALLGKIKSSAATSPSRLDLLVEHMLFSTLREANDLYHQLARQRDPEKGTDTEMGNPRSLHARDSRSHQLQVFRFPTKNRALLVINQGQIKWNKFLGSRLASCLLLMWRCLVDLLKPQQGKGEPDHAKMQKGKQKESWPKNHCGDNHIKSCKITTIPTQKLASS